MNHVLIVEPDLASGMTFFRTFVVAGFDADHVTSGPKAISAFQRTKSNVVVINRMLRSDHVRSVIDAIQSRRETRDIPIVAYAFPLDEKSLRDSWLEGATESVVLGKRSGEDLLKAVQRVLGLSVEPTPEPAETPPHASETSIPPEPPKPAIEQKTPQTQKPVQSQTPHPSQKSREPEKPPVRESAPEPPKPKPVPESPDEAPKSSAPSEPSPETGAVPEKPRDLQRAKLISQRLIGTQAVKAREPLLAELHQCVQEFNGQAAPENTGIRATLSKALASLLDELQRNSSGVSSSSLRTIFHAVNSLDALVKHPAPASPTQDPAFKALAVDDQPDVLLLIQHSLKSARFSADGAKNAMEALELSKQRHYDLFVLDIMMPKMNGFELCEKLRVTPGYEETPVIFITGADSFDSRVRSAHSGGNDFIAKPFLPKELALKALFHLLPRWIKLRG